MTKTLTLDEMLDCLELLNDPAAPILARQLEALGDQMALILATRLEVGHGATRREESDFAGTCATFFPVRLEQPCPHPLDLYDSTEWDSEAEAGSAEWKRLRLAQLEHERDSYVLGHPNGHEEPNPEGWAEDNPEDAEELESLYAERPEARE